MRAYIHVKNGTGTLHLPRTPNRVADAIPYASGKRSDGWYRASATWEDNGWNVTIGTQVDPAAEAERLLTSANKSRDKEARTRTPGIHGFMQRERASTGNISNQVAISHYFAELLCTSASNPAIDLASQLLKVAFDGGAL